MKKLYIICVLTIFLIGANSVSGELKSSEDYEKSLETFTALLNDVNKRLSTLENNFQTKEKQLKDTNSDDTLMKDTMVKMNKRLVKIEETTSFLDLKDTLASFEGILDVIKKRLSDIAKKTEDMEVNIAVREKLYQESYKSLETPIKVTKEQTAEPVSSGAKKVIKEQTAESVSSGAKEVIKEQTAESVSSGAKEAIKEQTAESVSSGAKEAIATTIKNDQGSAITEAKKEQAQIAAKESVEKIKAETPKGLNDFKEIGNDFYARNVVFADYSSASIVKGEISNNSRNDFATVSFNMKIFSENNKIVYEFDFSIVSFQSGATRPFDGVISGVKLSEISKYEIVLKRSL